jgi:YD repeat-containing protein
LAGTDTVRGINYQHAQALVRTVELLREPTWQAIRVEGSTDAVDLEILGADDRLLSVLQFKTRATGTWGAAEVLAIIRKWTSSAPDSGIPFEFVTNGDIGPSGRRLINELQSGEELPAGVADLSNYRTSIHIVSDPADPSTLFDNSVQSLLRLLPSRGTGSELLQAAERYILNLHYLISQRSAMSNPTDRLIRRSEVSDLVGLHHDVDAVGWNIDTQQLLLSRIPAHDLVEVRLIDEARPAGSNLVSIQELISGDGRLSLIHGDTGSGKSMVAHLLQSVGVAQSRVVIATHAEGYVPGRLGPLLAFELERLIGIPVPLDTGWDILRDEHSTVIIDGVSEIDARSRQELSSDLRRLLVGVPGAKFILVGRDRQTLARLAPQTVTPETYRTVRWDYDSQRRLVAKRLALEPEDDQVHRFLRIISGKLGVAIENPFILAEATALVDQSTFEISSRPQLYAKLIELRLARSGEVSVDLVEAALGVVFAALLDQERRFCDAFEWVQLCELAASLVPAIEAHEIDEAARRSGIVNTIGARVRVVPFHDSIADYLAAVAQARALVLRPPKLHSADVGRLSFLAELGHIDSNLATMIIEHLPFDAVSISSRDRSAIDTDTPVAIANALRRLLPERAFQGLAMWESSSGHWLELRKADPAVGWISTPPAAIGTGIIVRALTPLKTMVDTWRDYLPSQLSHAQRELVQTAFTSAEPARDAVLSHQLATESAVRVLCETVMPSDLVQKLGGCEPELLEMRILPEPVEHVTRDFAIRYRHADSISVEVIENEDGLEEWQRTYVRSILAESPTNTAIKRIRSRINDRTLYAWLP